MDLVVVDGGHGLVSGGVTKGGNFGGQKLRDNLGIIARRTGVRKRPFRARFPVSPDGGHAVYPVPAAAERSAGARGSVADLRRLASDQCIGNDNSGAHSIAVVCIRMEWDSMEW